MTTVPFKIKIYFFYSELNEDVKIAKYDCTKGICSNVNGEVELARLASVEFHELLNSQIRASSPTI